MAGFEETRRGVIPLEEQRDEGRFQTISECGCAKRFFYGPPPERGKLDKRLTSSCSDEASFYAPGQKVLSYSLYIQGRNETKREALYKESILQNLKRIKTFYPGSSMRLYTDMNLEEGSDYCRLLCGNPELHWCDVRKTPSLGDQSGMNFRTWRFLPLGDPTVDYFLSRDLDSIIIERMVGAVNEWLHRSDKAFHVMRDHQEHESMILAGLWGARNSILGWKEAEALRNSIMALAKVRTEVKGHDQTRLWLALFFQWKHEILAFDSYFCDSSWGRSNHTRPFPMRRKDIYYDFAGNINLGRSKCNPLAKCPVECRPEYGKDWEYC